MANNSNIVNINKQMHENSKLKVSPAAVKEVSSRINDKLYDLAIIFDKIALKHGRKTVMEEDVIEAFGFVGNDILEA